MRLSNFPILLILIFCAQGFVSFGAVIHKTTNERNSLNTQKFISTQFKNQRRVARVENVMQKLNAEPREKYKLWKKLGIIFFIAFGVLSFIFIGLLIGSLIGAFIPNTLTVLRVSAILSIISIFFFITSLIFGLLYLDSKKREDEKYKIEKIKPVDTY